MITGGSTLDPGFPTWGTMLREHGYHTRWYGKWHLTHHDNQWTSRNGRRRRSSATGSRAAPTPRPTARPGQGWRVDPHIADQFADWFTHEGGAEPWCTTVSFVNPHDIAWWYAWSDRVAAEAPRPAASSQRCRPTTRRRNCCSSATSRGCSARCQDTAAASFGAGAVQRPRSRAPGWLDFLDLYVQAASARSTATSGTCCARSRAVREVAANTVIVFTSDHGEYGALARPARQGRERLRGGASACR